MARQKKEGREAGISPAKRPNVILLVLDSLRACNVNKDTMPFLTNNAPVQFSTCYSPSTWTLPSYASIYTMDSPILHNVTKPENKLSNKLTILPDIMREQGYETSLFSENPHFGMMHGLDRGIDFLDENIDLKLYPSNTSFLEYGSMLGVVKNLPKLIAGKEVKENMANILFGMFKYMQIQRRERGSVKLRKMHNSHRILQHINYYLNKSGNNKPKAVFTNFLNTHCPHMPSQKGQEALGIDFSPEELEAMSDFNIKAYLLDPDAKPPTTRSGKIVFKSWNALFKKQLDAYKTQIWHLDTLIKMWMNELDPDIRDNSLIIITADHGELFGEENRAGHNTSLHPYGIHIPFFMFPPKAWSQKNGKPQIIIEPVSLIGLSKALRDLSKGKVASTNDLVNIIIDESKIGPGHEVMVALNGCGWRGSDFLKKFDAERIRKLIELRKLAIITNDREDVYQCYWSESKITHTCYNLKNGTRIIVKEDDDTTQLDMELENWLLGTSGKQDIKDTVKKLKFAGKI